MDGIINILKPTGMTSHDVVSRVRKKLKIKKVGHTGTLDPNCAGVLPILIGKATRLSDFLMEKDKIYRCQMTFGKRTDTLDSYGKVLEITDNRVFSESLLEKTLKSFIGDIEQIPPKYSAIKINGKKLYEYARNDGKVPEIKKRKVSIYDLKIISYDHPNLIIDVHCSKGTYIRTLVSDIAEKLGTVAYMSLLIRTKSGNYDIGNAVTIDEINDKIIQKVEDIDLGFKEIILTDDEIKSYINGEQIVLSNKDYCNYKNDPYVYIKSTRGKKIAISYIRKEDMVIKNRLLLYNSLFEYKMKTYTEFKNISKENRVATIGNFDGVHLGHKKLLEEVLSRSKIKNQISSVITFDEKSFDKLLNIKREHLISTSKKLDIFSGMGIDETYNLIFTNEIRILSCEEFISLIKENLNVSMLILGFDAKLGSDQKNAQEINNIAKKYGIEFVKISELSYKNEKISSSKIRTFIKEGNIEEANYLLDRKFSIDGNIIKGNRIGRKVFDIPTANIEPNFKYIIPKFGVYYCTILIDDKKYKSAVNVGVNPTIKDIEHNMSIEAFVLEFSGNLYDKKVSLEFNKFLRPEIKFETYEHLKKQMDSDIEDVRKML